MADSMQNFLGKHVEKIILAAAIVIFAVSLTVFVVMRDTISGDQGQARTQVEGLVKSLVDARKAPGLDKALTPEERIALGIDQAPPTGEEFPKQRDALPPPWDATIDKWVEPKVVVIVEHLKEPVAPAIVPVTDLQVFHGRGTTAETVPNAVFKLEKPALADIVWAGVVGHLDLTDQLAAYNKAHDPLDTQSGILVSKVELQRREEKPDGTWSEWKPVMPALTSAVAAKWPKLPANPRDKAAANAWYVACKTLQADIRRMPLYALVGKDKQGQTADMVAGVISQVEQPEMRHPSETPAPAAPAAAPAAGAAPAPAPEAAPPAAPPATPPATPEAPATGAASPWATAVPATPTTPTTGATQPVEAVPAGPKHVIATLWAYDTSIEPGKTYQYQMRASVVSPIYSDSRVLDDKARWTLEFAGAWSDASREVTIPNLVDFFFVGMASGDRVNLELHRWILSQWVIQPSVQSSIGAPVVFSKRQKLTIPGAKAGAGSKDSMTAEAINVDMNPQALLVDVLRQFPYVPEGATKVIRTNVLIYADARGQLDRRTEWDDKNASRAAKAERAEPGGPGPVGPPPPTPLKPLPPRKDRPTPTPKPPTPRPTR